MNLPVDTSKVQVPPVIINDGATPFGVPVVPMPIQEVYKKGDSLG
jgi:hypothetical protein